MNVESFAHRSSLIEDGNDWDQKLDELFAEGGLWRRESRPATWPDPEESMPSSQFWTEFEACLGRLPEQTSRVFMMREFLGFESKEICDKLGPGADVSRRGRRAPIA